MSRLNAPLRFSVNARAGPQTLGRIVDYFAQIGVTPLRVRAFVADDRMAVLIEQRGISEHQAGVIAEKLRASVLVESVRLHCGRRLLHPLSEQPE